MRHGWTVVAFFALATRAWLARNAAITGNTTSDIFSETFPRLGDTTCGTSDGPDGSWGVCADD
jgi:hypothetical protein